jgi:hypothetical protein
MRLRNYRERFDIEHLNCADSFTTYPENSLNKRSFGLEYYRALPFHFNDEPFKICGQFELPRSRPYSEVTRRLCDELNDSRDRCRDGAPEESPQTSYLCEKLAFAYVCANSNAQSLFYLLRGNAQRFCHANQAHLSFEVGPGYYLLSGYRISLFDKYLSRDR